MKGRKPILAPKRACELVLLVASNAVESYAKDLKQKRLAAQTEADKIAKQKAEAEFISTVTDKELLLARVNELDDEERKQFVKPVASEDRDLVETDDEYKERKGL